MKINPKTFSYAAVALVLLISLAPITPTADHTQDITFRLMNIERRLDQLQSRVDFIERAQQNQAMNNSSASSNLATETAMELQRQHLSLAGQVVELQKRMLDLKKEIDRVSERAPQPEKKEPPKEDSRSKSKPVKPGV